MTQQKTWKEEECMCVCEPWCHRLVSRLVGQVIDTLELKIGPMNVYDGVCLCVCVRKNMDGSHVEQAATVYL